MLCVLGFPLGCQGSRDSGSEDGGGDGVGVLDGDSSGGESDGSGGLDEGLGEGKFDVGDGVAEGGGDEGSEDCTDASKPTPDAELKGTVYAPNGEIPIPGALVYTTNTQPDGIPDEVYCETCVELECEIHWVLTEPDGSFNLPAVSGTGKYLVVQKGQFMKVTEIDIGEGASSLDTSDTSLPGKWDPAQGQWIPKMAVDGYGSSDSIRRCSREKRGWVKVSASGELQIVQRDFRSLRRIRYGRSCLYFPILATCPGLDSLSSGAWMRCGSTISSFFPCGCGGEHADHAADGGDGQHPHVGRGGRKALRHRLLERVAVRALPRLSSYFTGAGNPELRHQRSYESNGKVISDEKLLAWLQATAGCLSRTSTAINTGGGGHFRTFCSAYRW